MNQHIDAAENIENWEIKMAEYADVDLHSALQTHQKYFSCKAILIENKLGPGKKSLLQQDYKKKHHRHTVG